nr:MAG TPA: hypothetical protein [Caudoviricetes sp.]
MISICHFYLTTLKERGGYGIFHEVVPYDLLLKSGSKGYTMKLVISIEF